MLEYLKIDLSFDVLIFIIIVLFFFCLWLFIRNKQLKDEIEDLKLDSNVVFNCDDKNDVVSIDSISDNFTNIEKVVNDDMKNKNSVNVMNYKLVRNEKSGVKTKSYKNDNSYIQSVLEKKESIDNRIVDTYDTKEFDINDFVKGPHPDKKKYVNEEVNNSKNFENSYDYLKEVSDMMAKELAPQTIELTDYEQAEEDNAIISYQELIGTKNSNVGEFDDDETINFIEELKKLRDSLN